MAGQSGGNESYWYLGFFGDYTTHINEELSEFPAPEYFYSGTTSSTVYPGHQFVEWNTAQDGTGTSYQIGDLGPAAKGDYYAIWEKVEQEDLIISNHSLIDLGDAVRKKSFEANDGSNLIHTSLTIPNMVDAIDDFNVKKPPLWFKSKIITGSSGYNPVFDAGNDLRQTPEYFVLFIAENGGSGYYYQYLYVPTISSSNPCILYFRNMSKNDYFGRLNGTGSSGLTWLTIVPNITISTNKTAGTISFTTPYQYRFGTNKILFCYKEY